jgi:uncharacterized membrane protein
MTTPIVILALLTLPYLGLLLWNRVAGRTIEPASGAAVGLSLVFLFFGLGHFVQTASLAAMLPPWVPQRVLLIYITGALEWTLAVLLLTRWRAAAAWACIAVLVLFFPANIYAAFNRVEMGGHSWGPVYLLIRAPLQLILIAWAYWFVARNQRSLGSTLFW